MDKRRDLQSWGTLTTGGSFDAILMSKKYGSPEPVAHAPIATNPRDLTEIPGSESYASETSWIGKSQITSAPSPD